MSTAAVRYLQEVSGSTLTPQRAGILVAGIGNNQFLLCSLAQRNTQGFMYSNSLTQSASLPF
ncbi:MAG: hypothetical protein RSC68_14100 [Acinetobacter sp.]